MNDITIKLNLSNVKSRRDNIKPEPKPLPDSSVRGLALICRQGLRVQKIVAKNRIRF